MWKIVIRKLRAALAIFLLIFCAIVLIGIHWLSGSPAMAMAINSILHTTRNSYNSGDIKFRWWSPWKYSENAQTGRAVFTLCATRGEIKARCFLMVMKKNSGEWFVVEARERE
jgi:hypothetical protein